jgi:antitoxin ParD1/3/4
MPAKHSRHIALTGPLAEWVDGQVAKGEYTSVSDLVRTAIRALRSHEEAQGPPTRAKLSTPPSPSGRA